MPLAAIFAPLAPLQRLIDADHQRAGRREGGRERAEQDAVGGQAGPGRAVEHPMVALEVRGLRQAQDPQGGRDRASARRSPSARTPFPRLGEPPCPRS